MRCLESLQVTYRAMITDSNRTTCALSYNPNCVRISISRLDIPSVRPYRDLVLNWKPELALGMSRQILQIGLLTIYV